MYTVDLEIIITCSIDLKEKDQNSPLIWHNPKLEICCHSVNTMHTTGGRPISLFLSTNISPMGINKPVYYLN